MLYYSDSKELQEWIDTINFVAATLSAPNATVTVYHWYIVGYITVTVKSCRSGLTPLTSLLRRCLLLHFRGPWARRKTFNDHYYLLPTPGSHWWAFTCRVVYNTGVISLISRISELSELHFLTWIWETDNSVWSTCCLWNTSNWGVCGKTYCVL